MLYNIPGLNICTYMTYNMILFQLGCDAIYIKVHIAYQPFFFTNYEEIFVLSLHKLVITAP